MQSWASHYRAVHEEAFPPHRTLFELAIHRTETRFGRAKTPYLHALSGVRAHSRLVRDFALAQRNC